MQDKHRLQRGSWKRNRCQNIQSKLKVTNSTATSAIMVGSKVPVTEAAVVQASRAFLPADKSAWKEESIERSNQQNLVRGNDLFHEWGKQGVNVGMQLAFEMDQSNGAGIQTPPLSSTCQTHVSVVERSRNVSLLQQKWFQASLNKTWTEAQPPVVTSTGDGALAVQNVVYPMNVGNKGTDEMSLSSVCTYDKERGRIFGIASSSLRSKPRFVGSFTSGRDAHNFNLYGNREADSMPLSKRIEILPTECGGFVFPQTTVSLNSQAIVVCENSNVPADSVASKVGACNHSCGHPSDIASDYVASASGVDICDSGSSTSGGKVFNPLLMEPSIQENSNTDCAVSLKVETTEYSINVDEKKPLVSNKDSDEVQQLTLLDILANAAIGACAEDLPGSQKLQGINTTSKRHAKRKFCHVEDKAAERLPVPKGFFLHGHLEYSKKHATRHTMSILKRFQSINPQNPCADAEAIGGTWAPLQGKYDFGREQIYSIDEVGSTLHQASQLAESGFANRSNLRRTAGLPMRLNDSVVELQSKRQSRAKLRS
ncbi:hypothetical protein O6H91_01G014000 [Diphasiastrum complanatum]|nr:hypothetical protein O6H91_01G014000 [Diphasiastrum complanatum]